MTEDKGIILKISTVIYPFDAILKALKEFSASCWVAVEGDPSTGEIAVSLTPKEGEIKNLKEEFYNYLLFKTKTLREEQNGNLF